MNFSVQELHRALGGEITRGNNGPQVLCPGPGHTGNDRSLAVSPAADGNDFIVFSHAGDDAIVCKDYVRRKLGLPPFKPGNGKDHASQPQQKIIAKAYDYCDEGGSLLFQVVRYAPKDFRQRRPDGKDGWIWNLEGVRRVPYQLPELLEALGSEKPVFICEGEKDVDALRLLGIPATCNPQGAGKWRDEYSEHFRGATVCVLPDNDAPGREHAEQVALSLKSVGATVQVLNLPELSDGGDVSDWINRGGTAEKLFELAEKDENAHSFIQSSAQFVSGFVPPDYLIDGLLQRRFLYSLTGRTGSGKTAITLLLAASVALGKPIGKYGVELGRVLYLAGENPDDIRMRWIAMAQQLDFDINAIDVHFIAGTFKISELSATIEQEVARLGGVQFVIVDTSAAFFEGEDDNSNVQHGGHARTLRGLVTLLGGPCVIANCHPVKNAGDDNLIPRGGGAFLAEVDGNLAARNDDSMVELHWQGKFRGPDFAPLPFQLRTVTQEQLKDSKGRTIPTIIASGLTEASREELAAAARGHEDQLLGVLCENDEASYADLARRLGWSLKDGQPNKMRVKRTLQRLKDYKLVTNERDRWTPTEKGRKAFKS